MARVKPPFKIFLVSLLLAGTCLICGCWNKLEAGDTAVAVGMVFDRQGDQVWLGVQLANPGQGSEGQSAGTKKYLNLNSSGRTFAEAAANISLRFPRMLLWPHVSVIILGSRLASSDLSLFADAVARNRSIRKTANVFVYAGQDINECMEAESELEPFPLPGLEQTIRMQENQAGSLKAVQLEEFLAKLAAPGVDPVAPRFTVKEINGKKTYELDGMSIFSGIRMVGNLNLDESRGYRILSSKMASGGLITINSPLNPDRFINVELTRMKAKSKPMVSGDQITFKINVTGEGNFVEQTGTEQLNMAEQFKAIDKAVNKKITDDLNRCIARSQLLGSDIFGWGQMIQQSYPKQWNTLEQDWPQNFKNISTDIKVDFKLRRAFLLDKSFTFR